MQLLTGFSGVLTKLVSRAKPPPSHQSNDPPTTTANLTHSRAKAVTKISHEILSGSEVNTNPPPTWQCSDAAPPPPSSRKRRW